MFKYENVSGAPSRDLPDHVEQEVIDERWERFNEVQTELADTRARRMVGQTTDVIIDGWDDEVEAFAARTKADAPEIDGIVYVATDRDLDPGDIHAVTITGAEGHELTAKL